MTAPASSAFIPQRPSSARERTKRTVALAAATAYTLSNLFEYTYFTGAGASMAFTLPGTSAVFDGMVVAVAFSTAVGTVTWAAGTGGAAVTALPASASANSVIRAVYDAGANSWWPF